MDDPHQPDLEKLLVFLKQNRGFDFTGYKRASLSRRIQRRMQDVNIDSFDVYQEYLEVHPDEFDYLFNTILINVTGFFRDQPAWDYLQKNIIPQIIDGKESDEPIRVWSAGSASGEEAYSAAMLLAEALGIERFQERVKIYGTDVDEEALNKARLATYSAKELQDVPEDLKAKYFDGNNGLLTFRRELRRALIFGRNDLTQDAPISRVDLLLCRNTLMYFNAETQAKILARFHFAMRELGFLFLGKAETLLAHAKMFIPVNTKLRVYSRINNIAPRDRLMLLTGTNDMNGGNDLFSRALVRELAFEVAPIAQFIVDLNLNLALANVWARTLLQLRPEDNGRPLQELELSYRLPDLSAAIRRSLDDGLPVKIAMAHLPSLLEENSYYEVLVQPLSDAGLGTLGVSVSLTDQSKYVSMEHQLETVNQELTTSVEELQAAMEEMETTQEELQSSMEEVETTNEELQSANEELETMNEEMQSVNEEIQTVNDELRAKTESLNELNEFMGSVLSNLHAGLAVLDDDLRVLVWNKKMEDLWGLRQEEVLRKNFLNLDIGLPVESIHPDLRASLAGKDDHYQTTVQARNRRGRDITCRVILSPLITDNHSSHGVIVLVEDLTVKEKKKTDSKSDSKPDSRGILE